MGLTGICRGEEHNRAFTVFVVTNAFITKEQRWSFDHWPIEKLAHVANSSLNQLMLGFGWWNVLPWTILERKRSQKKTPRDVMFAA